MSRSFPDGPLRTAPGYDSPRSPTACCNGLMQFNTYTVAGAHIAVWLVNHPSPGSPDLAAVLGGYDVHQPVTNAAQVRALGSWAQRLRELFEAATVAEKAELADALLVAA